MRALGDPLLVVSPVVPEPHRSHILRGPEETERGRRSASHITALVVVWVAGAAAGAGGVWITSEAALLWFGSPVPGPLAPGVPRALRVAVLLLIAAVMLRVAVASAVWTDETLWARRQRGARYAWYRAIARWRSEIIWIAEILDVTRASRLSDLVVEAGAVELRARSPEVVAEVRLWVWAAARASYTASRLQTRIDRARRDLDGRDPTDVDIRAQHARLDVASARVDALDQRVRDTTRELRRRARDDTMPVNAAETTVAAGAPDSVEALAHHAEDILAEIPTTACESEIDDA